MIPGLLWIIGFYAAAAALAHAIFRRKAGEDRRRRHHYVLVAGNHQMQIEWYVRSLQQFSRRTGRDIGITVLLDDSSDETGEIIERFVRRGNGIGLIREEGRLPAGDWERLRRPPSEAPEEERKQALSERLAASGVQWSSPQQVVWVELARESDLARLPL